MVAQPAPVDVHVGSRILLRRKLLGMSQDQLAKAIGVTFQQVQKYERGANRVVASRLFEIARVLNVPVSFFFDDISTLSGQSAVGLLNHDDSVETPPLTARETMEIAMVFHRIPDRAVRKRIFDLIKAIATGFERASPDEPKPL